MTDAGDRASGAGTREAASPVFLLGALVLCALPVFAHGCHRGDHDDEPAVVPVQSRVEPVRQSQ